MSLPKEERERIKEGLKILIIAVIIIFIAFFIIL